MENKLLCKEEVYNIMGACFQVYKDKGQGFVEPVYQDCLEIELSYRQIPFERQRQFKLKYRNQELKHYFTPDIICYGQVILELKAVSEIADEHRAQLINYLKVTGMRVGLIINFGHHPGLQWERMVF
jgi:GxxExxY protein